MKLIGNFLPDTEALIASILQSISKRLGAEEVAWTEFQIDQFETVTIFPAETDCVYLSKCKTQKFRWILDLVIALKIFEKGSGRDGVTGQLFTITLYKKPSKPELDIIPVCKISYLNHSNRGLSRRMKIYPYEVDSIDSLCDSFTVRRQFFSGIVLFLNSK